MLKTCARLGLAVFLAAAAPIQPAPSQKPPIEPAVQPTAQSNANQRDTDSLPLAVKLMNTGKSELEVAEDRQREDQKTAVEESASEWNIKLTFGLVIVGIIQALAIGYTAIVTNKAANAAKASADAVVSQLRAYVRVHLMEAPKIEDDRTLKVIVGVKNTGQTPAFNALIVSNVGIVSWPPPRPKEQIYVDTEASHKVELTIAPGEAPVNIPEMPNVTAEEESGLKAGAYRVIVWGRVTYVDVFKIPHTTRYAFSLRWENDKFGLPFFEEVGNGAD